MPVMLQRVRCDCCRTTKLRKEMSCFDAICMECFDRHYAICAECGILLRGGRRRGGVSSACLGGDWYIDNRDNANSDAILCYTCYYFSDDSGCGRGGRHRYWRSKPLDVSLASYDRIGSKRKFGVEIETSRCPHHRELYGKTRFGSKNDCTVSGLEFDSPILYGDEGLNHIKEFLDFASNKDWETDEDCGCHTHYDMRDESDGNLWRIAYAYTRTHDFWTCFVPRWRRDCTYSHSLSYTCQDIRATLRGRDAGFSNWCLGHDRYDFINIGAYEQHKTFENRLLEGCIDSNDICSWITINCRFIDHVKDLTLANLDHIFDKHPRQVFSALTDGVHRIYDGNLANWMADRARRFEQPLRGPGSASWTPPNRTAY